MPTLKAIHIFNSHQHTLQPKIAKEYVFSQRIKRCIFAIHPNLKPRPTRLTNGFTVVG